MQKFKSLNSNWNITKKYGDGSATYKNKFVTVNKRFTGTGVGDKIVVIVQVNEELSPHH